MAKIALYLAGGGARGAYQAGVLKAIGHILQVKTIPFSMISGVSVGSINAAILAQHADNFQTGIEKLDNLWREIHCQDIFKATNFALAKSVARNLANIFIKQPRAGYLLDTEPLHEFINKNINFELIKKNIANHHLELLEVISNCYESQQTVSFYDCLPGHYEDWNYPRHMSEHVEFYNRHILASGALPLFFPTVNIDGLNYGDGSMGLVSPLRGAIRFNVDKILILGTRQPPDATVMETPRNNDIGFAHVLGNMLNGLFLDNLDRDIEMVNRMNEIAILLSIWKKRHAPWRPIQTMHLRPSIDLAPIAQANYHAMPKLLQVLLNLLGAQNQSGDLLSFLLFEKQFTEELLDQGYRDTLKSAHEIGEFFSK